MIGSILGRDVLSVFVSQIEHALLNKEQAVYDAPAASVEGLAEGKSCLRFCAEGPPAPME